MSANSAIKRAARIKKRCVPEVTQALRNGEISARSADVFLKLSPKAQQAELDRRLKAVEDREEQHALVARTIKIYLDNLNGGKVNLIELTVKIAKALQPL